MPAAFTFAWMESSYSGVLELPRVCGRSGDLMRSAQGAYEEIFSFLSTLDSERPFKLWRVWNYIPDIHGEEKRTRADTGSSISGACVHSPNTGPARSSMGHSLRELTREIPASCGGWHDRTVARRWLDRGFSGKPFIIRPDRKPAPDQRLPLPDRLRAK